MRRQAQEARKEEESQARAERRLAALTEEQYRALFEKSKAELVARFPRMAGIYAAHPDRHEAAIRAGMIRWLEEEPMDLLVIDPPPGDPEQ
jgi:hypothetical protein